MANAVYQDRGDSAPARVAIHLLGSQTKEQSLVVEALERAGIESTQQRTDNPGIVVFDKVTDEVTDAIYEFSNGGYEPVLAVTLQDGSLECEAAWRLLHSGASDVVVWHGQSNSAEMITARVRRWLAVERLLFSTQVRDRLAGSTRVWLRILRQIVEVARFTDSSVLITGPSGTGKELIAQLIHDLDLREQKGRLVVLDCTTVVQQLSGSEFFGHERGAFTDAGQARDGTFAKADGGTLFLDEVGELPLPLQAELLRVVQERTYKRVGGNTWRNVNFRLVCATNRDLEEEQERGAFRADFYHRLANFRCHLPSLDERRGDILPLTNHFLKQHFAPEKPPDLDASVRDFLVNRSFPGNIRELKQLVEQTAHRHLGVGPITIGCLPASEIATAQANPGSWPDDNFDTTIRGALSRGKGLDDIRNAAAERAYNIVLTEENSDTAEASRRLKVSQRAVQQHLRQKKPR